MTMWVDFCPVGSRSDRGKVRGDVKDFFTNLFLAWGQNNLLLQETLEPDLDDKYV